MTPNQQLFKSAMNYGLFYALISIVISIVLWVTRFVENSGLTSIFFISILNIVAWILILVFITKHFRDKKLGCIITFRQAFYVGVLTIAFGSIIIAVYNFIFHSWIDPEYSQRVVDAMIDKTYDMMVQIGSSETDIDKVLAPLRSQETPTPIQQVLSGLQQTILFGVILALISGAIVKKNKIKNGFESAMNEIDDEE